jgi:CIC family chloride channel protein
MSRLGSQLQGGIRLVREWPNRLRLSAIFSEAAPLDLRIVGRTLIHAALVGGAAGLTGAAFFAALEYVQASVLEGGAGYTLLRAYGEEFAEGTAIAPFRPWLLALLPAAGGLLCGLLTLLAPETRGGGGDALIAAFHHGGAQLRSRVVWLKALASLCTLGSGGAGGREGPTMQIGGALGSLVARRLGLDARSRRILLVAGVAAGVAAVFRTPFGAALLAVEILYRDGFESDALVPSVLSSVVAYSVVISIFGESTLFAYVPRFPFTPKHLLLYGLLALTIAAVAALFAGVFARVRATFDRLQLPTWLKPALGGLALGTLVAPIIVFVGDHIGVSGQGLGILGGGYGAVQMAISGSPLLPGGWNAVWLLLGLSLVKIAACSLTIGSGGSAGDFAPSLAIGGLFGGAFGRAAALLLGDPLIQPGAFALVGMSTFYGGIAHVPLSALVLTCELAGNYDLLVPLMLSQGIAFIALRKRTLYPAQVETQRDSPVYRDAVLLDVLRSLRVSDATQEAKAFTVFERDTPSAEMVRLAALAPNQDAFPVCNAAGELLGIVSSGSMRVAAAEFEGQPWTLAVDLMQPAVFVQRDSDLRYATELMVKADLRQLPVLDDSNRVIGLIGEVDVAEMYLRAARRAEA